MNRVPVVRAAVAALSLSLAIAARAQGDGPTEQAVGLVNQGKVERAIEVLTEHLQKHADDVRARVVLGRILDHDGRPDEAVTLWEQGITGREADFPLLMAIGGRRRRQGEEGPLITRRRGMVTANPSKDAAEEERQERAWLEQAARAYEKALRLRPVNPDAASALASVYDLQKKTDAAVALWKSLVAAEPGNSEFHLALALAAQRAGRPEDATRSLENAIRLNPRFGAAYLELAKLQKAEGRAAEAERSEARANFYNRLPPFSTLTYSAEHAKTLDALGEPATVKALVSDPSETATEFLAVVCWSHPHNALEDQAFAALESRGARTTPLLRALLDDAQSTCTIRSTAHILARRKADGLLSFLVERLPGDFRGFGMEMDIAGSLDDLGDPRAVAPLVQLLDPADAEQPGLDGLLADRASARSRAALALGAFDTPESRRALEQAARQPRLAPYCLAALYRLTRNPSHVQALEKTIAADDSFTSYLVGDYLLRKAATPEARRLARTWEKQRAAQEAAEAAAKATAKPHSKP